MRARRGAPSVSSVVDLVGEQHHVFDYAQPRGHRLGGQNHRAGRVACQVRGQTRDRLTDRRGPFGRDQRRIGHSFQQFSAKHVECGREAFLRALEQIQEGVDRETRLVGDVWGAQLLKRLAQGEVDDARQQAVALGGLSGRVRQAHDSG